MKETVPIKIVLGDEEYEVGTMETPYTAKDLGLMLIEAGVLLRHTYLLNEEN